MTRFRCGLWLSVLFLSSCGLLRDPELPPPRVQITSSSPDCQLPDLDELSDARRVTEEKFLAGIRCLERYGDGALEQIEGSEKESIAISELRTLHRKGVLNWKVKSDSLWTVLSHIATLFHPQGKPRLQAETFRRIITLARRHAKTWVAFWPYWEVLKKGEVNPFLDQSFAAAAQDAIELISPSYRLSVQDAQDLLVHLDQHFLSVGSKPVFDLKKTAKSIQGIWIYKSIVLADEARQGPQADITGPSLKKLFHTAVRLAVAQPQTRYWAWRQLHPQFAPRTLLAEVTAGTQILIRYFTENHFAHVDSSLLAWGLKQFASQGAAGLALLTPDLVRISQRLSPPLEVHGGLHVNAFVRLLEELPPLSEKLIQVARAYPKCRVGDTCRIPLRAALKIKALQRIALKGLHSEPSPQVSELAALKPLDWSLDVNDAFLRTAQRSLLGRLFGTLDSDGDGVIALSAEYQDQLREAVDLAYTFLRFMAIGNLGAQPENEEEKVVAAVPIRPQTLYGAMGLVGDRWVLDGDANDQLDADELFSVVQFYTSTERLAGRLSYTPPLRRFYPVGPQGGIFRYNDFVIDRFSATQTLALGFESLFPDVQRLLLSLPGNERESFFHGILGLGRHSPTLFYEYEPSGAIAQMNAKYFLEKSDLLPPAAVFVALDQLMIRCDRNEDQELDWNEMDCAVPLILEGGFQVVSSSLVELDPVVHDSTRILLSFLQRKGMPRSIAKLALANGSFSQFKLFRDFDRLQFFLSTRSEVSEKNLKDLAEGLMNPRAKLTQLAAQAYFATCDTDPQDGLIRGWKELTCLAGLSAREAVAEYPYRPLNDVVTASLQRLTGILEGEIFKYGLILGVQNQEDLDWMLSRLPLRTDSKKITQMLSELLRREAPAASFRN